MLAASFSQTCYGNLGILLKINKDQQSLRKSVLLRIIDVLPPFVAKKSELMLMVVVSDEIYQLPAKICRLVRLEN